MKNKKTLSKKAVKFKKDIVKAINGSKKLDDAFKRTLQCP